MTNTERLTALKGAREILDKTYCKWTVDDGDGGHCAQGAVLEQLGCSQWCPSANFYALHAQLVVAAQILHPELKGAIRVREGGMRCDYFDVSPLVYINNQLGKEAALAVFDAAILELEIALASTEVKIEAEPELVGVSG